MLADGDELGLAEGDTLGLDDGLALGEPAATSCKSKLRTISDLANPV